MSDKRKALGRPPKYKPEYCDAVIEAGKQGKSNIWMAAQFNVHKDTFYEWRKVYPEFDSAVKLAQVHCQKWWEDVGQDNLLTPQFKDNVWSRNMAARFPDDWREKQNLHHTGDLVVKINKLAGGNGT